MAERDYGAPTRPDDDGRIDEAKRDAEVHAAYFLTLTRAFVLKEDALKMVVAYIQSKNVAKLSVELPPETPDEDWKG